MRSFIVRAAVFGFVVAAGAVLGLARDIWCGLFPSALRGGVLAVFPAVLLARVGLPRGSERPRLSMASLLVLAFALVLSVAAFYAPESKNLLHPLADTRFAPGFTPEKFRTLKPGMSESQVLAVVGPPIYKQGDLWFYSSDGAAAPQDWAWQAWYVGVQGGRVVGTHVIWCCD